MKVTNFNPDAPRDAATGTGSGTATSPVDVYDGTTTAPASTLTTPVGGLTDNGGGSVTLNFLTNVYGGQGTVKTLGNLGSTETLNLAQGNYFTGTLDANTAITFTGWQSGKLCEIGLRLTEDSTGGYAPAFSGITWIGGTTPTHTTTASSVTDYIFWSTDGGTTIYGGQVGVGGTTTSSSSSTSTDHFHAVNEEHTGDGSSTTFSLANESEPYTIAAYVAGVRVDVTQTTYDVATFASAPAAFASVRFDYLAANS